MNKLVTEHLGIIPPECGGCFVSPEFPVFTVRQERVFPELLDAYFFLLAGITFNPARTAIFLCRSSKDAKLAQPH